MALMHRDIGEIDVNNFNLHAKRRYNVSGIDSTEEDILCETFLQKVFEYSGKLR